jgi:hypothetical protein
MTISGTRVSAMSAPGLFDSLGLNSTSGFRLIGAKAAYGLATITALFSVASWIIPAVLGAAGGWLLLVDFVFGFVGLAVIIVATGVRNFQGRATLIDGVSAVPPTALPNRLKIAAGGVIGVAVVSMLGGFVSTAGYSQNPQGTDPHCEWSIGTNHGLTNICVSHSRWVATGDGVIRASLGFLAIFLTFICIIIVKRSMRSTRGRYP